MRNNCLFFALSKWIKKGGYLIVRKSRMGWFPHFLWCGDLRDAEVEHFAPVKPKGHAGAIVHKVWFKGTVKNNDRVE